MRNPNFESQFKDLPKPIIKLLKDAKHPLSVDGSSDDPEALKKARVQISIVAKFYIGTYGMTVRETTALLRRQCGGVLGTRPRSENCNPNE